MCDYAETMRSVIRLPTLIQRLNAGLLSSTVSPCPDLMYPINPAFFTGWLVPDHVELLAEDLSSQVALWFSAIPAQLHLQQVFLGTTTSLHLVASPSAHWPTLCGQPQSATAYQPAWLRSLGPYARRSPGLLHFRPGPQTVACLGRYPQRRSGIGWLLTLRSANPYAVLLTSS